jgi:uncharacterized protein (DUF342 family)
MAGLPPAQREKMRLLGRKLTELTEMEGKLEQERKDLVESMRALRGAAQIHVTGTVYQKVDLFLGRAHMGMTDAMKAVTFRLSETEEVEAVPLRAQRTEAGESVPPEK